MFDNFVKLKTLDKLMTADYNIYTIVNIRDNTIFLNTTPTGLTNNTFVKITLIYQPFSIAYINFDASGNILSTTIPDNKSILMETEDSIRLSVYVVSNNSINITMTPGVMWVRILDSNCNSYFENSIFVPSGLCPEARLKEQSSFNVPSNNIYNTVYNNKHPIQISGLYDAENNRVQIFDLSGTVMFNNFDFYFMQPVQYCGTYNYIRYFAFDTNTNSWWIYFFNNSSISAIYYNNTNIMITFTPSYCNEINYFTQNTSKPRFRYNFGFQMNNYDMKLFTNVTVSRFVLYNGLLVNINTLNYQTPYNFYYGWNIIDNQNKNFVVPPPPGYEYIYFYNNRQINEDGFVSNSDTLFGSYHLIAINVGDYNTIHLVKTMYPNNVKFFTNINTTDTTSFYLDKLLPININTKGEITYNGLKIYQSNQILEINTDKIQLIKKYNIRFIGMPIIDMNQYKQQFEITDNITFASDIYNGKQIYFDENLTTPHLLNITNNTYYIVSSSYLSNTTRTIYTCYDDYILSSLTSGMTKKKLNLQDSSIDFYVNAVGQTKEYFAYEMLFSYNGNNNYSYKFINEPEVINIIYPEYVGFNMNMNPNETYIFNTNYNMNIVDLNYINRTLILTYLLNDSTKYTNINVMVQHTIDENETDSSMTLQNVKQLRINLINGSIVQSTDLFTFLKPWSNWSLLNGILGDLLLKDLVSNVILIWQNEQVVQVANTTDGYLTNNDITMLTTFLQTVSTSSIAQANYILTRDMIEPYILANLKYWLANPQFFLNVMKNINDFLYYSDYDVYFDGMNLLFKNDTPVYITINGVNEIASYITNEYTYDSVAGSVMRTKESYDNINLQILNWTNSDKLDNFGVSIHKLLRYLKQLGDQYIVLLDNFSNSFTSVSEDASFNALSFITNRVWENNIDKKTNLQLLDKTGISSVLYPYTINFTENTIVPGSTYSVHFINGDYISQDLTIDSPNIYPDQINFYTEYNIKPLDFIYIKKSTNYNISSYSYLGTLWSFGFNSSININYIDMLSWRDYNLTINMIDTSNNLIYIYIPEKTLTPSDFDIFEIRNDIGIVSINVIDSNQYLTFYNNNFNYIQNQTFLNCNIMYLLQYDETLNQYYVNGPPLQNYNVVLICTISPTTIVNMGQSSYQFIIDGSIDKNYDQIKNNNIIVINIINITRNM